SYSVRQAAATAYGALCAVLCSLPIGTNGRQNHGLIGNVIDRYIGWALPSFSNANAGDGTVEFAAESLHEFLSVGDFGAIERYALPILKACQDLLEDERTSLRLLHRILTVLTIISLKFFVCFQAHFVDIVDLLLGWAMIPDLAEADRSVITDSFLQFQKHWVNNLQFSLGLLSKFLGDMDVLLQDGSPGTPQQRQRLLVLLSCFSTVLQSTASGLLEINLLEQIKDPLSNMLPQLLGCLSMVGKKCGWSKWIVDSWKCLTLLAEILSERFSSFYSAAVDILFQSLDMKNAEKLTSFQVHGVLKTNLQLLSLQKLGLLSSSVHKILQFNSPVSQLRLHPNHLVTSSSAATYVFLLQHGNNDVVQFAITLLLEELNMLKNMAGKTNQSVYSKTELFALFKFDMKVLLSCVSLGGGNTLIGKTEIDTLYVNRSEKMASYLIENLNPFESPIQGYMELQVSIFKMLNRLSTVEFLSKFSIRKQNNVNVPFGKVNEKVPVGDLRKYAVLITRALHVSSPLAVKLEALQWLHTYCQNINGMHDSLKYTESGYLEFFGEIVFSVLDAASDREPKVRSQVASVLEMFLHSKLIHPSQMNMEEDLLERTCSTNLLAGAWWAIHEAARYCITTRLRTNLGGPSQTFAALEQLLLDVAHVLQVNSEQSDANLNISGSHTHLLPLRLLLDFVESLKKNVYNAYDGSTVLPSPSRQSLAFFRQNKKVCEEWFSRICEPMMNAGMALQCHDATIHYCSLRLQELKNLVASSMKDRPRTQVTENLHNLKSRFSGDILRVLRHMTLSLCKNHEPEALIGLQKWASVAFFPLFEEENQDMNDNERFGPLSWIQGLVYQAQGQHEKAAAHFTLLLQTEGSLGSMGSEGVQFSIARIIESYSAFSDWKSLESWLSELQLLRAKHAGKSYSGALTMAGNELNLIHALAHFDDGDYKSAWACLDLTPKSSNELALDPKVALQRSEQMLLQAMLFNIEGKVEKVQHELQKAKLMLKETFSVMSLDGLTEAAEHVNQLHCISAFEESCKPAGTANMKLSLLLSSYMQDVQFPSNHIHQDCKPWMKVLRIYRTIHSTSPMTLNLSLNLLKLARKQSNLILANRLNDHLSKCNLGSSEESSYKSIFSGVLYEGILLMHAENRLEEAYIGLWSFISPSMVPSSAVVSVSADDALKAKACLKLSKWLRKDHLDVSLENIILKIRSELGGSDDTVNSQLRMEFIVEELVGTATKLSSSLCPTMGKSWICYASWCYAQARASLPSPSETALQSCSFSPILGSDILPNRFQLTEEELSRVESVVLELLQKARDVKDLNGVPQDSNFMFESSENGRDENYDHAVVQQVVKIIEAAAGEPGSENYSRESLSAVVTSQLQKFFRFASIGIQGTALSLFDNLVDVWWSLRKRRVSLFGHAAQAFINYLSHSSSKLWGSQLAGASGEEGEKNASYTLKATLYVLHILLDYGVELKAILEPALLTVPLLPWQEVTPQIFARLSSHPEEDVRKQLESILAMLAKQSPWSIIYPTLVDINTSEEDPSEELQRILACLNSRYPRLVQDVQLMIKELENVTILWEELWLSTLQDLHSDVLGRINLLKEEASRIAENVTLSHPEKTKINAAPLGNHQISLGEVAPQLALLSSSDVPMPGREDQRLDARIMQLLQAINSFLHSSPIRIRYYSVTPISGRAGLIQWVENVTSIYNVYKSWQHRVHAAQVSAVASGNAKNSVQEHLPRPTEMFHAKIIPALKEKGIRKVISRKDWPHEVKRKVFSELMQETPKQLLHQEIWCASEGFKAFRSKLKRYSGSVAAMSMVGHILGLGDRHLDNILLDFHSGDIVHIDYNVCFDKGQRLKVPEIVPFRMTQTIEAALGLTGTEGSFKNNCEAVLGILKKNKDVLLMLLEVFVWDPLVEWTRGDFHDDAAIVGEERKGMELAVSLSLFASRVQEIRVPLQVLSHAFAYLMRFECSVRHRSEICQMRLRCSFLSHRPEEHHDLLLTTLPAIESALQRFADVLSQYETVSAVQNCTDQERSSLIFQETSAKAIVAEATSNLEKTRTSFELQAREFAQTKADVAEKALEATTWIEQHGRIIDALRSSSIQEIESHIQLTGKEKSLALTSAVLVAGVPFTVVPEPTQVQCHDIDREVSQLISDLDHGLTAAVSSLQTYSVALQRVLPLNYHTTSPVQSWAQILKLSVSNISSDVLSLTRRQGAELVAKVHEDSFEKVKSIHNDLCFQVEKYADEIERVEKEYQELVNSIGAETESRSKDRLMAAFAKLSQSTGQLVRLGSWQQHRIKDQKLRSVVGIAVSSIYNEVKHKLLEVLTHSSGARTMNSTLLGEFEEKIEKCVLVADWVDEVKQLISLDRPGSFETNWASIYKTSLVSCKSLAAQMVENVIPNVVRSVISYDSEIMDAFGSLSQIRGSIDTALEQLVEVQIERASLAELEQSYFVKVGFITEQQLALEEASVKGRDHLSWEEAEELASQEEACRAQLDELHQTWNQKDIRTSSLIKREESIRNALISAENHLQSIIGQEDKEPQYSRSKALLLALVQPFFDLESVDNTLSSLGTSSDSSGGVSQVTDMINYGSAIPTYIWKFSGILGSHLFFIWKVAVMDSFLDSCIRVAASSRDQNLGFDQVVDFVKKKLTVQLQEHIGQYLRDKVAPLLLTNLDTEIELLKQVSGTPKDFDFEEMTGAIERVKLMLEEYCNAHETVRAGMSAASLLKRQVKELKEGLHKTCLDIIQLEWMHDLTLSPLHNCRLICHKFLSNDDNTLPVILNLSRPRLLETIRSSVSNVVRSIEGLQACEQTSVTAEGQLERAMSWACGGPNSGSSGIPPEFQDHLANRRKLLWGAREKASDIIKICMSILDFETSRDGVLGIPGELHSSRAGTDGRAWQQAYYNALTNLDTAYHSFTRTEHEWQLAQSNLDTASIGLLAASNELLVSSGKAKSASGNLQDTFIAMRDCAYEASMALSSFGSITRGHTALTSECGSMLEEVLAITRGLHDVHTLGKEASALHSSLMGDLSKANSIVVPLESVLSKDVEAMTEAMTKERETKTEIAPIHGQAIYHSYHAKIKEACHVIKPLVPSLTVSVKGLHSILTRLARTANIHAGNLHKALEGLGESQEIRSQEDVIGDDGVYDNKESDIFSKSDEELDEELPQMTVPSLQDKGWISPPDSIYDDSSDSDAVSAEASVVDSFTSSEITEPHTDGHDCKGNTDVVSSSPSELESSNKDASQVDGDPVDDNPKDVVSQISSSEINVGISNINIGTQRQEESHKSPTQNIDVSGQVSRVKSKNAYAVSVLRRVEMKIEGRDITDNRDISIAEQVDYLLRQATSADNLCNMYEGQVSTRLKDSYAVTTRYCSSDFSGDSFWKFETRIFLMDNTSISSFSPKSEELFYQEDIAWRLPRACRKVSAMECGILRYIQKYICAPKRNRVMGPSYVL
ncbi:serine/threonine-protein kinase SMG1, partial [Tanacetum coccineum]